MLKRPPARTRSEIERSPRQLRGFALISGPPRFLIKPLKSPSVPGGSLAGLERSETARPMIQHRLSLVPGTARRDDCGAPPVASTLPNCTTSSCRLRRLRGRRSWRLIASQCRRRWERGSCKRTNSSQPQSKLGIPAVPSSRENASAICEPLIRHNGHRYSSPENELSRWTPPVASEN